MCQNRPRVDFNHELRVPVAMKMLFKHTVLLKSVPPQCTGVTPHIGLPTSAVY
jgi:hypothetical protein